MLSQFRNLLKRYNTTCSRTDAELIVWSLTHSFEDRGFNVLRVLPKDEREIVKCAINDVGAKTYQKTAV